MLKLRILTVDRHCFFYYLIYNLLEIRNLIITFDPVSFLGSYFKGILSLS
jgi:hypothetical protein